MVKFYVFITALLMSLTVAYLELMGTSMSSELSLLTWLPTIVCAVIILYSRREAVFSPMFILYNVALFGNSVRYIVLSMFQDEFHLRFALFNLHLSEFESGSQIYATGVLAMCAGYVLSTARPMRRRKLIQNRRGQVRPLLLFCIAGVFFAVLISYLLQTGLMTDISAKRVVVDAAGNEFRFGPRRFLLNIALVFFQLLLVYAFINKGLNKRRMIIGIATIFIILFAVTLSKRSTLLITFLPIGLVFLNQFKFTQTHRYILGAFLTMSIVLFISGERKKTVNNATVSIEAPLSQLAKEIFFSSNFSGLVATSISTVVVEDVPPFKGTTFYIDPITQFIPRTMWPNKPEELGGRIRQFHQDSGFAPKNYKRGGTAPGLISEAWLNFRMGGVISIMLLYGFILGGVYRRFLSGWITNDYLSAIYLCYVPILTLNCFGGHFARLVIMSVTFAMGIIALEVLRKADFKARRGPPIIARQN